MAARYALSWNRERRVKGGEQMTGLRIFLFANGDIYDPGYYRRQITPEDRIICADGGSRHVLAMGMHPSAVVGDRDSLDPALHRKLQQLPVEWICNPLLDQEQSDLEMALHYAVSFRPAEIILCGALGGNRADHALINLFLLTIPFKSGIPARIIDERQTVRLMDRELIQFGRAGDYLSLFSLAPETRGVTTQGLKYPLHEETLYFASTRGLSNELISETARVTAASGLLLAVHTARHGEA